MNKKLNLRELTLEIRGVGGGIAGGTLASSGLNPDAIVAVVPDEIERINVDGKLQLEIPLWKFLSEKEV